MEREGKVKKEENKLGDTETKAVGERKRRKRAERE